MKKLNANEMRKVEGGGLIFCTMLGSGIGLVLGWFANHVAGRPGW